MKIGSRLEGFTISAMQQRFNPAAKPRGFTIVETLIVLAVTGFLFLSAALLISGRQAKTEFSSGTRDFDSRLQQVINEVSNGYYPNNGSFKCSSFGGIPTVTTTGGAPVGQGTNKDCIFLGKVIQFNVDAKDPEQFYVYSVVGLREVSPGKLTTTFAQAKPQLIALDGTYDIGSMPFGLTTQFVRNTNSGNSIGAVAFLSNLGSLDVPGPSQQVDVVPINNTTPGETKAAGVTDIQANLASSATTDKDPAKGVQLCLKSGTTNQWALYTIGGQGRQLTVTLAIKNNSSCT